MNNPARPCLLFIGRAMGIKNPISGTEMGFREVNSIVSSGESVEWTELLKFRYEQKAGPPELG
jgi:hypothetical protein